MGCRNCLGKIGEDIEGRGSFVCKDVEGRKRVEVLESSF